MDPWSNVDAELGSMRALLETPASQERLYAFADRLERLIANYRVALAAEGKTSIRMHAVAKALDKRTKKSELERFVGTLDQ